MYFLIISCWLLLLFLMPLTGFSADNESINTVPDSNLGTFRTQSRTFWQNELPDILGRYHPQGWVYSGGLHTSSSSCTSNAFATEAFTESGNRVRASSAGTGGSAAIIYGDVGCDCANPGSDTAWVIISAMSGNSSGNFQRALGSNYFVNCVDTTIPALPADSAWLMSLTITNGSLGTPIDRRPPNPYPAGQSRKFVSVRDPLFNAAGNGVTNDCTAIQAAHNSLRGIGGTLYFPPGQYYLNQCRITWRDDNITWRGFAGGAEIICNPATDVPVTGNGNGCINIYGVNGTYIENVTIKDLRWNFCATSTCASTAVAAGYNTNQRGLDIWYARNVEITGNHFTRSRGEMLGIGNYDAAGSSTISTIARINNNYFTDFAQDALNPNGTEWTATGNVFFTGSNALETGASNWVFSGNDLSNTSGGVALASARFFVFSNNRITGPGGVTIASQGATTPVSGLIQGNAFVRTTDTGATGLTINLGASDPPERMNIQGNSFVNWSSASIEINALRYSQISGNLFSNSVNAISMPGAGAGGTIDTVAIIGNFCRAVSGGCYGSDAEVYFAGNVFSNGFVHFGAVAEGDVTQQIVLPNNRYIAALNQPGNLVRRLIGAGSTNKIELDPDAYQVGLGGSCATLANLGTPSGTLTMACCSNCNPNTDPATAGGSGAFCLYVNARWYCP